MSTGATIDAVVRAGLLLTSPGSTEPVRDAWVSMAAGRIARVGTGSPPEAPVVFDHAGDLVIPGFVNAHSHLVGALLRGLGGDRTTRIDASGARPTMAVRAAMSEAEAYAAARLAILELLLSGVTTTTDSQVALRGREEQANGTLKALTESGLRAVFFRSSIDRTAFIPEAMHDDAETAIGELSRLTTHYGSGRVTIGAEAMALHRIGDDMLDALIGFAGSRTMPLGIHGPYDTAAARHAIDRFGRSVVAELARRGGASDRLLLYHPVHVDESDIRILAYGDCGVAVCAVDNMLIGTGPAPLSALLDAGVRTGLGIDQPNDGHDMFQLMKATILQQRSEARSPSFGSPERMLELATTGGARSLHLEHEVGSIEPGKAADIVAIDGMHPTMHPRPSAISNLVYAAGPQSVRSVYVAGRRVVHDGRHVDWDHAEVASAADAAFERCIAAG